MAPDSPIAALDLSRRLTLALERRGVATVGALCAMTGRDLARLNGVGQACLVEVSRALAAHGMALADERRGPSPTRRVNLTLTEEMYAHLAATYPEGKRAQAMEDAYRAQHGMPPRPPVQERGRFTSERNPRKKP